MEYIFNHLDFWPVFVCTILGMLVCYLWSYCTEIGKIHAEKTKLDQVYKNIPLVQIGISLLKYLLTFVSVFVAVALSNHLFPPPAVWGK